MRTIKDCCCGLMPLRTGCIVISIICLIFSVSSMAYRIQKLSLWDGFFLLVLTLVSEILTFIALLIGTILNNPKLVLASLIGVMIAIVARLGLFIALMILDSYWTGTAFLVSNILFFILAMALYIYFGIVIYSFYRTLGGSYIF